MDSLLPLLRRDKLRVYVACQDEARPKWETVRIPTLALFGEDDEYVDPTKNMALLAGFNNARITTGLFPRADHNLKKAFNPTKYPDIDWPSTSTPATSSLHSGSATTCCADRRDNGALRTAAVTGLSRHGASPLTFPPRPQRAAFLEACRLVPWEDQ
jgi:hypothetical protein